MKRWQDLTWYSGISKTRDKSSILKVAIVLFLLLIFMRVACGATIKGNVYDINLNQLNGAIVKIDSQPAQQIIAKDSSFAFDIPAGTYTLNAKYYQDNLLKYEDSQGITVADEGIFVYDLILFPSFEDDEMLFDGYNDTVDTPFDVKSPAWLWGLIIAGLVVLLAIALVWYFRRKASTLKTQKKKKASSKQIKSKPEEGKSEASKSDATKSETRNAANAIPAVEGPVADNKKPADDYYETVFNLIKSNKRITQKEIRKEVPLSEAKISLIISEMEHKGIIEKIKKGRGNIIVMK